MSISSKLKPFLKTVEDKNLLVSEVSLLLASVYSSKEQAFEDVLQSRVRPELSKVIHEMIGIENKETVLKQLEKELEDLEVVHLTLAYQPNQELIETISNKIQAGEQHRLLTLEIKPSLAGGLEISSAGKFANFSLQKKIEEFCASAQFHSLLESHFS